MIKKIIFKFILLNNYIKHHLTHLKFNILNLRLYNNLSKKYSFWNLNLDTFLISIILSILFFTFIYYIIKNTIYKKKPSKLEIFLDIIISFIYINMLEIYGKKNKFVFSLAFSTFTWIFINNLIGIMPIDIFPYILYKIFNLKYFLFIPSGDINFTFAIAITTLVLIFIYKIYNIKILIKKNLLFPFNTKILLPFNILLEIINYLSKILSLSLRLFGNMYSGEIIFILIYFVIPLWIQWLFVIPLMILHIFISFLQAFIFMALTIIYIS